MANQETLLTMKGIVKRFPGTLALDQVDLDIRPGEVHVLLGENGAGKSTLVKIIAGVYTKDGGEMTFDGRPVDFRHVREAQDAGISIIHQELNLLPERSIAQNIYVGREPTKKGLPGVVDLKTMVENSRRLMDSLGPVSYTHLPWLATSMEAEALPNSRQSMISQPFNRP